MSSLLGLLSIPDRVGTGMLQASAAIDQFGETDGRRRRREALVTLLILSPAILGLLVTVLPAKR